MILISWNVLIIDFVENWYFNYELKKKSLEMFFWELFVCKVVLKSYDNVYNCCEKYEFVYYYNI